MTNLLLLFSKLWKTWILRGEKPTKYLTPFRSLNISQGWHLHSLQTTATGLQTHSAAWGPGWPYSSGQIYFHVLPPGGQGCAASHMFILFTGHKYQGTRSVRVRLPVICISKHAHWYKLMYSMTIPLFPPIYLGWVFSLILKNCVRFF